MQRRRFLESLIATSLLPAMAHAKSSAAPSGLGTLCGTDGTGDGVLGLSQGFFEVRHRHEFFIPLQTLILPPDNGFTARCSSPLKGQTDFEGLRHRTNDDGSPLDLSAHAHTVSLSQKQLQDLSRGRHVTVDLAKFGHQFYFVADDVTLKNIAQLREGK